MKILVLTKYASMGASSRERFMIYHDSLVKAGARLFYQPLLPNQYLSEKYKKSRLSILMILKSYLKRLITLVKLKKFDLVWLQYESLPYVPFFFERISGLFEKQVVVDFDDAIYHTYDQHKNFLVRFLFKNKIKSVMRSASVVVVGNQYLKQYAEECNAKKIIYLPTVVNTKTYRPIEEKMNFDKPCVIIGWLGSPSTAKHLALVKPVLKRLQLELHVIFNVMGVSCDYDDENVETQKYEWSEINQLEFLSAIDIGIMPLLHEPFARGKCGYKLIQYMAYAKPVVATPLEANKYIVKDRYNGYLPSSLEEWYEALKSLCLSAKLRKEMGERGRSIVEKEYSVNYAFPVLFKTLKGCLKD